MTLDPADTFTVLAFARGHGFLRRCLLWQARRAESFVVRHEGRALALAMFMPLKKRLREFALVLAPGAEKHLIRLMRLAHLTLSAVVQNGILVKAHVRESDARARRMAGLCGFRAARLKDTSVMIWRSER